jgi:hypothetical protein
LGARRRTYEGTLNTITTTVDAGQPFEVFDVNVQTIRVGTNRASGGGGSTGTPWNGPIIGGVGNTEEEQQRQQRRRPSQNNEEPPER